VPSRGPGLWSPFDPTRGADVVVGHEVADAFELIWPTGEIDEQFLGWPLTEEPGAALSDAPRAIESGPAPGDVVLAFRQEIGPDPVAMDQPALLPCLPERAPVVTEPTERRSTLQRLISRLRRR
jgi:hypothetical protein